MLRNTEKVKSSIGTVSVHEKFINLNKLNFGEKKS